MKREFSAGGIVFNSEGQVLLVKAGSLRDESKSHWKFPKGHLDGEESTEEAAIREVKEETGIDAEIKGKIGVSKYTYFLKGEKVFKIVTYYKMSYLNGRTSPQLGEIEEVMWVLPEKAEELLSFPADRKLLEQALFLTRSKN
jgi:8-oxo-dGTP diphosphatase